MSTTMIVHRPDSPWPTWLGWGLLGGVLGVSGAVIHDRWEANPLPVRQVVYKPTAQVASNAVESPLWGWWETLDASEPTSTFRVEYRNDGTFVAQPLENSVGVTFLGRSLPAVGVTGSYSARRVGNGLKVQHLINLEESPMPAAIVATYGRTATVRVPGGALDSWIRLGRVDYDPRTELY